MVIGLDLVIIGGAIVASVVFFYFANKFFKESQEIASQNREKVVPFGRSIAASIIAGGIIITLDRVFVNLFNNPPTVDFSSLYGFFASMVGIIVVAFFVVSFLLLMIFYLILKGLKGLTLQNSGENRMDEIKQTQDSNFGLKIKGIWTLLLRKIIPLFKSRFFLTLVLFAAGIIIAQYHFTESIKTSIKLSEESLNETAWLTSPVTLEIAYRVDKEEGRLYINATNTHPLRETGAIYLYKLEDNPFKPEMVNEGGIGSGDVINYSLTITSRLQNITFSCNQQDYGWEFTYPASKLYYVLKDYSISFKIACDNCPSNGFIRRIPDFGAIENTFTFTNECVEAVDFTIYEWLDFDLEDITINNT